MTVEHTIYIPGQQWGFTLENDNENYSLNIDHHKTKDASVSVKAVDYPLTKLQYEIFLNSLFTPAMEIIRQHKGYEGFFKSLGNILDDHKPKRNEIYIDDTFLVPMIHNLVSKDKK